MEKQLLEYVEQESKRGVSQGMIKKALRSAGWDERTIEEAFSVIESRVAPPRPQPKNSGDGTTVVVKEEFDDGQVASKKSRRVPVKLVLIAIFVLIVVVVAAFIVFNYKDPSGGQAPVQKTKSPAAENKGNTDPATTTPRGEEPASVPETATDTADALDTGLTVINNVVAASSTAATSTLDQHGAAERDDQRMSDMKQLLEAQKSWHNANSQYYTCNLTGGDCKGKPYGYPAQIGQILALTPKDPIVPKQGVKLACGKDFVYCGLNNASYPQFFCYFAKLEGGGYYTASHAGNFKRSTPPKIFEECAAGN